MVVAAKGVSPTGTVSPGGDIVRMDLEDAAEGEGGRDRADHAGNI